MSVGEAFFIARGRSLEAATEWIDVRDKARQDMISLLVEVGAGSIERNAGKVEILVQPGANPGAGWKAVNNIRWRLNRKTPEGKALAKRLDAIREGELASLNVGCGIVTRGFTWYRAKAERVGEQVVIVVPVDGVYVNAPLDAEHILDSEYWQLREAVPEGQPGHLRRPTIVRTGVEK